MTSEGASPIWKRRIAQYVRDDQAKKAARARITEPDGGWTEYLRARVSPAFLHLVHECAKQRGMTYAAYIRRCVAIQMAKDTGIDVRDILALTPYPAVYGARSARPKAEPKVDDGTGFGQW